MLMHENSVFANFESIFSQMIDVNSKIRSIINNEACKKEAASVSWALSQQSAFVYSFSDEGASSFKKSMFSDQHRHYKSCQHWAIYQPFMWCQ